MLGEAALTDADAKRYLDAYTRAIAGVARAIKAGTAIEAAPSISVKLSALFARY
jgi:RHH-type proline utilization regulon transcriptional repressor/proline dehydrogenase/delta 1-pyrroline-5-carboxylate dehydrogenase